MELIRSFIAIELDTQIKKSLGDLQEGLKKDLPRLRWVDPANIHLTLKFLGEIPPQTVEQVKSVLQEITPRYTQFSLSFNGVGVFPKPRFLRVLWVGIEEGKEETARLADSLEEALSHIGFESDPKGFKPHVTLARANRACPTGPIEETLRRANVYFLSRSLRMQVEGITLFQSQLSPQGPHYTPLFKISLNTT